MKVLHVDHIGINVIDLSAVKDFFVEFGFKVVGEMPMHGELVDRVTGLKGVRDDIVMLESPDGQINIELVKFHNPIDKDGIQPAASNRLGLRHITFQVEDVEGIVETLNQKGIELMGKLQTYGDSWRLCYVRGPEEIIIELAEKLN